MPKASLPKVVYAIYDATESVLGDLPDADIRALLVTIKICDALHAPERVYIPHGNAIRNVLSRRARNENMISEFTGNNHKALARLYGLTERHVRRIVSEKK